MARVDVHKAKEVRLDRHLHASAQTGPPKCRRRQVGRPATTEGGHMRWAPNVRTSAAIRLASLALTALRGGAHFRGASAAAGPAGARPRWALGGKSAVATLGGDVRELSSVAAVGHGLG